jgi:hypothetical protein
MGSQNIAELEVVIHLIDDDIAFTRKHRSTLNSFVDQADELIRSGPGREWAQQFPGSLHVAPERGDLASHRPHRGGTPLVVPMTETRVWIEEPPEAVNAGLRNEVERKSFHRASQRCRFDRRYRCTENDSKRDQIEPDQVLSAHLDPMMARAHENATSLTRLGQQREHRTKGVQESLCWVSAGLATAATHGCGTRTEVGRVADETERRCNVRQRRRAVACCHRQSSAKVSVIVKQRGCHFGFVTVDGEH